MLQKKILLGLWITTIITIFIVTIFNHQPYFIMGGSTSVSPLMHALIDGYPENHKGADFTYNSLGSDAAIQPVIKKMFGIGWLSKEYKTNDKNLITFVLSRDGMILVYNLPQNDLGNDKPLDFSQEILKKMYLSTNKIYWKDLFSETNVPPNTGWVKSSCQLEVKTYTRENGSGTRDVFNEKGLGDKTAYYPQAVTVNSSTQMFGMAPGGIGYSSYSDKKQLANGNIAFKDVHIGQWLEVIPSLATIQDKSYELARPFTGVININYANVSSLIKFLRFLFVKGYPGHDIVTNAFKEENFAQAEVPLTDNLNSALASWLSKFP